jgi:bacteriorhodopsin
MDSETDFRTNFVRIVCENSWIWAVLLGFALVVLIVLLLLLPVLQPGSRTYYITLVTIGLSSILVVAYGATAYRCRRYHRR